MTDIYFPKDLAFLIIKFLPRDDQKKLLVFAAIREILPIDLIELIVCYLNYSEAQKVFLALHHHKDPTDHYSWRTFETNVDRTQDEWWEDVEWMSINTHPVNREAADDGFQYKFSIEFGNRYEIYELGAINNLTVEYLLPSNGLNINVDEYVVGEIFEQCRPKYLDAMQAAIDQISTL